MTVRAPAKQSGQSQRPAAQHRWPRHAALAFGTALALTVTAASAGSLARPKVRTVVIESMQFSPQQVEVKLGETVVWTNKDFFPHTATAEDHSFDSGEIATNRSWRFKPRKKGVFPYVCTLHPTMKGRLVVK
jgi:plastocyanin